MDAGERPPPRRDARPLLRAATRDRFSAALREKGWDVTPSRTNFVWCRPPAPKTAEEVQAKVRNWGFLLRRFADDPKVADHLRISMGTDEEMDELLRYL